MVSMESLSKRLCLRSLFLLVAEIIRSSEMRALNSNPSAAIKNSYVQFLNGKNAGVWQQPLRTIRLYSRGLSAYVRITSNTIDARRSNLEKDRNTLIVIESHGPGRVAIKSKNNGVYVCFDKNSIVKVLSTFVPADCLFNEIINRRSYVTFQSVSNNTWYLGFSHKKNNIGSPKPGRKTNAGQRSIMFVKKRTV